MKKIDFPVSKHKWSPSLIPGGVVLISTSDYQAKPHFAPKSWFQMVSFEPSIVMFAGTQGNPTENFILSSGEFVVNIVDETIAEKAFNSISWHGEDRIEKSGFTYSPSKVLKSSPLINECKAHLECKLIETKSIGSGFLIFGEIVAASIWDQIIFESEKEKKYKLLKQIVFQEDNTFSVLDSIKAINH